MCNFHKNKKISSNHKEYVNNWALPNARKCPLNGLCRLGYQDIKTSLKNENSNQKTQQNARERTIRISRCENAFVQYFTVKFRHLYIYF
jgi:hypothetical protein